MRDHECPAEAALETAVTQQKAIMTALEIAVAALREIAKPNGVLCRTCGARLEECAANPDPAPDRCAGLVAREVLVAIAAISKTETVAAAPPEHPTWRMAGCECPADARPGERCSLNWIRCNERLRYLRPHLEHRSTP